MMEMNDDVLLDFKNTMDNGVQSVGNFVEWIGTLKKPLFFKKRKNAVIIYFS